MKHPLLLIQNSMAKGAKFKASISWNDTKKSFYLLKLCMKLETFQKTHHSMS